MFPRIDLYRDTSEDNKWTFDREQHDQIVQHDLQQAPDVILTVGTTAAVLSMQDKIKLFCAHPATELAIWINPDDAPPVGMKKMFKKIKGDADGFARLCFDFFIEKDNRIEMVC